MMKEAYYKIADIVLHVEFDFLFPVQNSYMKDFLIEPCKSDYTLRFVQTNNIPLLLKKYPNFVGEIAKFH